MNLSVDISKVIFNAARRIVLITATIFIGCRFLLAVKDLLAYWNLLIILLGTVYIVMKLLRTLLEDINCLLEKLETVPLVSVPLVGWFARKWDERQTREAAKRIL